MTNAALTATNGVPAARNHRFIRLIRRLFQIVTAPVRAFQAVRHAMTPASVSLLLLGIVTLNIIWGFPWTGMFSACVGMFVAGCLIHFGTRPLLACSFSLPSSSPAGQSFPVTIHANTSREHPCPGETPNDVQGYDAKQQQAYRCWGHGVSYGLKCTHGGGHDLKQPANQSDEPMITRSRNTVRRSQGRVRHTGTSVELTSSRMISLASSLLTPVFRRAMR